MTRVTTLGELHRPLGWLWVICDRYPPCIHRAPMALPPFVIRWGPDTSGDVLPRCARSSVCGHRGVALQHPGWVSNGVADW
jgi:hypothetical protein